MAAKLIAEEGFLKGLELSLEGGEQWVIGRDPDACQLLIEDPSASRKHLLCRTTAEGIIAENLSETNPVEINEKEIKGPYLLHHGDAVKIGNGVFRFYTDLESHVDGIQEPQKLNHEEQNLEEVGEEKANKDQEQDEEEAGQPMNTTTINRTEEKETAVDPEDSDLESNDTIFDEAQMENDEDALAQIDFGLVESGRWFLKVISGPHTGAEFSMQPSTSYVIGTDPATCDIVFHDVSVSRQHARLTVSKDDTVQIEDLKSRNGTYVDDEPLTAPRNVPSNSVVTMGTTTFVVLDREGKRDTIISPLLPSIVKVLQKEEARKAEEAPKKEEVKAPESIPTATIPEEKAGKASHHYGALILIAMVTGILVIVGIGTTTLFKTQEVELPQVNVKEKLDQALAPYPNVKYSFNKDSGKLFLAGHVLTALDRTQLLYNLQGLTFIKSIDPNIIIDEYVWQEFNQLLSKNPEWRGISLHSPSPGQFVITGYLKSRRQADLLNDYLGQNFSYMDLLEKRIVVEEDVSTQINVILQEQGFRDITVQMNNGEVILSGAVSSQRSKELEDTIAKLKEIPGVRNVNNFVVEMAPEQAVINITSKYEVTGVSLNGANINVVIKGRILTKGDILDGMTITQIKPNAVLLDKDGIKYRIDFNK